MKNTNLCNGQFVEDIHTFIRSLHTLVWLAGALHASKTISSTNRKRHFSYFFTYLLYARMHTVWDRWMMINIKEQKEMKNRLHAIINGKSFILNTPVTYFSLSRNVM